jgi:glucosyl-dolichyl phosphate glucuronosyltransferase
MEVAPELVYGCNCFVKRDIVLKLKGFNPDGVPSGLLRFRGDGETGFFRKVEKHGYRAYYDPIAEAFHRIPKERMTIEYLKKRYYNQGISDSYTQIRKLHYEPDANNSKSEKEKASIVKKIKKGIKQLYYLIDYKNSETRRINKILEQAHQNGFDFHQNEVKNDPELLKWVLKLNY